MTSQRRLWSLSGSLLLHGLALAGAVALVSREPSPSILIVELEEAIRVGDTPGPSAKASRGEPLPAVQGGGPRGAVRPAAPVLARPLVSEPLPTDPPLRREYPASAAQPEPSAAPSAPAPAEHPAPAQISGAPAQVPGPVSDGHRLASGSDSEGSGGIPGGGPLAMLVPGGRSGGEGAGGGEAGIPAEFGPYLAAFRQRIQEALDYPVAARRRGLGGTVQLEVELLPTGKVASVVVRSSSSHAILDQTARDTVSQLRPVPFPPGVPPRPLKVRLPIVFELK